MIIFHYQTRSWFDPRRDAALYDKKQVWSVYICTPNLLSKLKFTKPQYYIWYNTVLHLILRDIGAPNTIPRAFLLAHHAKNLHGKKYAKNNYKRNKVKG